MDVSSGRTNHNGCTQTYNLAYTDPLMNPITHQKLGQSDLLYILKSPAKKVGVNRHFQAS